MPSNQTTSRSSRSAINFTLVGGRIPWYATSSGLVLVADTGPDEQSRILSLPRPRFSVEPHEGNTALTSRLARVRREGHAVTRGYIHQDSTAVAVPIRGPYSQAVASLAVVVPAEGFQLEPVLEVLIPAARTISEELKKSFMG